MRIHDVSQLLIFLFLNFEFIMQTYFDRVDRVRFAGPKTDNPLAFRHYNPDEIVLGKRMADHLRLPPVTGITSAGMARICLAPARLSVLAGRGRCAEMAKRKADVAFEFSTSSTCRITASTMSTSRQKAHR